MNIAANMLNLDNAATPMGLQAMKEMQATNPDKKTASNAQIMFLVLNRGIIFEDFFALEFCQLRNGSEEITLGL